MQSSPEQFELPDQLREISEKTQGIIEDAVSFENDINSCGASYDRKKTLIQAAVNDLDQRAMNVFFGQRVEIEGSYAYPIPVSDGNDVILRIIHEYGVRRGESHGFFGHVVSVDNEEANPDELPAKLFHGVALGTLVLSTSFMHLTGTGRIQAPVTESGLSLCSIEDYKSMIIAEQRVRSNEPDAVWADMLDENLYSVDGPDLKALGDTLNQLRLVQGDKVHDYVSYINTVLRADAEVAAVLCDHLLDYVPQQALPVWISTPELISGWNPTIGMGDSYKMDRAHQRVIKQQFQEPVLTLRAMLNGSSDEHVLHIPLDAIQCSEFK